MILVTGATGLVGGNLLWFLLKENEKIVAIKRKTSSIKTLETIFSYYTTEPRSYLNRIEWREADVLNSESLSKAMIGVSKVYHCAAVVSVGKGSDAMVETNVSGTRNIVEACLNSKIEKLCFVSSIAACGKSANSGTIDEKAVWEDNENKTPYSRSKYYSEQEVWKGIEKGLDAVIVNPGVILGVSGNNSGSSQLFFQVKKGLLFYTEGGSGYVDVEDVVKAMILLTNSQVKSERFIIVNKNCSNKEILWWMADGLGKQRAKFNVSRPILYSAGFCAEMLGKIFRFTPLIDRNTAKTATNREYYSNKKLLSQFDFEYHDLQTKIKAICSFIKNQE
jgi:nucleoside-diphosphate-sugar epimerase